MSRIKNPNATAQEVYDELVKAAGLYGKAFFRQRLTKEDEKKLKSLWKLALRTVSLREEKRQAIMKKVMEKKEETSTDN